MCRSNKPLHNSLTKPIIVEETGTHEGYVYPSRALYVSGMFEAAWRHGFGGALLWQMRAELAPGRDLGYDVSYASDCAAAYLQQAENANARSH